jgi:hypothetical protein
MTQDSGDLENSEDSENSEDFAAGVRAAGLQHLSTQHRDQLLAAFAAATAIRTALPAELPPACEPAIVFRLSGEA